MKSIKTVVLASAIIMTVIFATSCKDDAKKEAPAPMSNEMHQKDVNGSGEMADNNRQESRATAIVDEYLSLKNALVADNSDESAEVAGGTLVTALEGFDVSNYSDVEQKELEKIVVEAKDQAENISDSPIEKQRGHFKILSKNITDMVAITGTDKKLYEQFCPMYDKGTAWLSASDEIKNPYYGSEMLNCGKVQMEIN